MKETNSTNSREGSGFAALMVMLFGLYLIAGGYYGIVYGKWPVFMPPQLDVIGLLLGFISNKAAGYVGGGILFVIGVLLGFGGLISLCRRDV